MIRITEIRSRLCLVLPNLGPLRKGKRTSPFHHILPLLLHLPPPPTCVQYLMSLSIDLSVPLGPSFPLYLSLSLLTHSRHPSYSHVYSINPPPPPRPPRPPPLLAPAAAAAAPPTPLLFHLTSNSQRGKSDEPLQVSPIPLTSLRSTTTTHSAPLLCAVLLSSLANYD